MTHVPDVKQERACRLCRWYEAHPRRASLSKCHNPGNMSGPERAVHGERGVDWDGIYADWARSHTWERRCGKDGVLFEPKIPKRAPTEPWPKSWLERAAAFFGGLR